MLGIDISDMNVYFNIYVIKHSSRVPWAIRHFKLRYVCSFNLCEEIVSLSVNNDLIYCECKTAL